MAEEQRQAGPGEASVPGVATRVEPAVAVELLLEVEPLHLVVGGWVAGQLGGRPGPVAVAPS